MHGRQKACPHGAMYLSLGTFLQAKQGIDYASIY